jgi:hypothetical protein
VTPRDRPAAPTEGRSSPLRSLNERRIDPGTARRENIDPPSLLPTHIPRGRDNTGTPAREPVKR